MSATFPSVKHRSKFFLGSESPIANATTADRFYLGFLRLISAVGLGITGYLAYASLMTGEIAGCGGGQVWDCGHVLNSRWSKLFGYPVSLPAFALYAIVLGSLLVCRSKSASARSVAWGVATLGALAAGMAAVWFVSLQIFDVGRLCVYCMAAHACGIALCVAILWKRPLGTRSTGMASSVSALCVGVIIAGQLLVAPPETFKIERFAEEPAPQVETTTASTTETGAASPANAPEEVVEVFEPF
ncbi:MAG: vitamin K epoxide reductase family protein [Planctomycetaceae bacterium]